MLKKTFGLIATGLGANSIKNNLEKTFKIEELEKAKYRTDSTEAGNRKISEKQKSLGVSFPPDVATNAANKMAGKSLSKNLVGEVLTNTAFKIDQKGIAAKEKAAFKNKNNSTGLDKLMGNHFKL